MITQTKSAVEWRAQEVRETWSPLQRTRRAADGQRRRDWFVMQFVADEKDPRAAANHLNVRPAKCG